MNSDVQILRAAMETEIDGFRFFFDSAGKTGSAQVRQIWLGLCNDEIEHMRLLQAQLNALNEGGRWSDTPSGFGTHSHKAPVVTGEQQAAPASTDLDALKQGLKVEENTFRFYENAAKQTTDALGKKTYDQLAKMEMGHYKLLEETILMFSDPSQWQYLQSPPMLEG